VLGRAKASTRRSRKHILRSLLSRAATCQHLLRSRKIHMPPHCLEASSATMFFTTSPTSSLSSISSSSTSSDSPSGSPSYLRLSPSTGSEPVQPGPVDIFPAKQTCAYPSWPRRTSLTSTPEDEPTAFLSDDDLFALDLSEKPVETLPSYHTIDLTNCAAPAGRPDHARYRAWQGNVTESDATGAPVAPRRRRRRSSKKNKTIDRPMSPILESPE
jgi:hypothetical protein